MELSHLVMDEATGTWRQSFVSASINLATIAHILLCMSLQNVFIVTLWKNPISTGSKMALVRIANSIA